LTREQYNYQQLNSLSFTPFHNEIPDGFYPYIPSGYPTEFRIPSIPSQFPYMSVNSLHNRQLNIDSLIPDWIFNSIRAKSTRPDLVTKEKIDLMTVHMKPSPDTQIAAFATIHKYEGIFVLFEKVQGKYHEVYVKNIPVVGVQNFGYADQSIVLTGRTGDGSGSWEYTHFVIRYTPQGYKEVWSGLAQYNQSVLLPYLQIYGGIIFVSTNSFIYFQFKQTTNDPVKPPSIETSFQLYKYNEQKMKYELVPELNSFF
jgi:hypothetical protein